MDFNEFEAMLWEYYGSNPSLLSRMWQWGENLGLLKSNHSIESYNILAKLFGQAQNNPEQHNEVFDSALETNPGLASFGRILFKKYKEHQDVVGPLYL